MKAKQIGQSTAPKNEKEGAQYMESEIYRILCELLPRKPFSPVYRCKRNQIEKWENFYRRFLNDVFTDFHTYFSDAASRAPARVPVAPPNNHKLVKNDISIGEISIYKIVEQVGKPDQFIPFVRNALIEGFLFCREDDEGLIIGKLSPWNEFVMVATSEKDAHEIATLILLGAY